MAWGCDAMACQMVTPARHLLAKRLLLSKQRCAATGASVFIMFIIGSSNQWLDLKHTLCAVGTVLCCAVAGV
jgi:hypothetical protein